MTRRPTHLPDVNVLVALLHVGHVHHADAHAWFADAVRIATTPVTEIGLLRLALNPAVMGRDITPTDALASLRSLRADPRAVFLADDCTLAETAVDLVGLAGHRQVTDMHLVALAAKNDAVLVTFDRAIPPALTESDRRHVLVLG